MKNFILTFLLSFSLLGCMTAESVAKTNPTEPQMYVEYFVEAAVKGKVEAKKIKEPAWAVNPFVVISNKCGKAYMGTDGTYDGKKAYAIFLDLDICARGYLLDKPTTPSVDLPKQVEVSIDAVMDIIQENGGIDAFLVSLKRNRGDKQSVDELLKNLNVIII